MDNLGSNDSFFMNILPSDDRQNDADFRSTLDRAIDLSHESGCFRHTLVTIGNRRREPWSVAQYGMMRRAGFSPLIAVNPVYQHPSLVAQRLATLSELLSNRIAVNLVTGSFVSDMKALGDTLDLQQRNERLVEFYRLLCSMLEPPVDHRPATGKYFSSNELKIHPRLPKERAIDFFVSGSLAPEMPPAHPRFHLFFIQNARPLHQMLPAARPRSGLGIGWVARATEAEAESAARDLFPSNRQGSLLFSLALSNRETPWNIWLRDHLKSGSPQDPDFYLEPMLNFWSSAPYIVGSYEMVARRMQRYRDLGYRFFLVDHAPGDEEHVARVIRALDAGGKEICLR